MDTPLRARVAAAVVVLACAALAAAGCGGLRDQAVPGCPSCGDPLTTTGRDGTPHVLARLRLRGPQGPPDIALGLGPWTLERGAAGADER